MSIKIVGKDLSGLSNEPGGHRIQRVPPTERKGRVHTSTVTVAVIDLEIAKDARTSALADSDFQIEWYSGTGAGGQHRNRHMNSCRMTHVPTGIVKTAQCRSRQNSFDEARSALLQTLTAMHNDTNNQKIASDRKQQVGSGMRGDKRRTYRFQDDSVTDDVTGKKTTTTKFMKGFVDVLWN